MMATVARASFRRNNHLTNNLLRLSQPSFSGGSPRGNGVVALSHLHFSSSSGGDNSPLPSHLRDKCEMRPLLLSSEDPYGDELPERCRHPKMSVRQDDTAAYVKAEMPGVSKEDTMVYLQGSLLVLKGVRKYDPELDEGEEDAKGAHKTTKTTYLARWGFVSKHKHKISAIKSVMKDGLLKVTVPKIKDEDRADLVHLPVD